MGDKFIFLSHTLSEKTPGYGGKKDFSIRAIRSMKNGDSCNQSEWQLSNHVGTHIDAPFHFSNSGKTLDQFSADFWIFNRPQVVHHPAEPSQIIDVGSWCDSISPETDLLIIKTDFERCRHQEAYWAHNPGLSPNLGLWFRKNRLQIKVVGFDFISLTSYDNRALGKEAHQAFLREHQVGHPLLIIEDMHLSELKQSPKKVIVAPLRVELSDGSPVTIMAEL